jgi:hypothetical protein
MELIYSSQKRWSGFLLCCISVTLTTLLNQNFIISDALYYNNFAESMTVERIEEFIDSTKKWSWISYSLIPFFYFIKFTLVAACISTGLYFQENRFRFKEAFGLAIWAEGVFILVAVVKLLWFVLVQTNYTLQDLQFFFPLSTLNFFDVKHLEPYLVYPLQVLNLFEIVYWFVLAYGIKKMVGISLERGMTVVASSYGVGLVIWVVFVVFLTLNLN